MKVTCTSCKKSLNVPDDKIPIDKPLTFKCPGCKNPVTVSRGGDSTDAALPSLGEVPETTPNAMPPLDETQNIPVPPPPSSFSDSSLASSLDSLESEMDMLADGSQRAMVADKTNFDIITPVLKKMDYAVSSVENASDALKKLQFNTYDLIILNDRFDGADPVNNPLLKYLEPLNMDVRRRMFIVLIGKNFKSLDNMTALTHSVNMVLNENDFGNFELILKKGIKDNERFYAVFRRMLVETGKEVDF